MKSVLQKGKYCYLCRALYGSDGYEDAYGLHDHHIFYGTANRKQSEKYGLKVWLCPKHHNMSDDAVHKNRKLNLLLKTTAQLYFEANIGTHEDFIKEFGKSYL